MNVSVGPYWEEFIAEVVKSGRYGSASEVMRVGLRFVQAEEAKLQSLRETIQASLKRGGAITSEELDQELDNWENETEVEAR